MLYALFPPTDQQKSKKVNFTLVCIKYEAFVFFNKISKTTNQTEEEEEAREKKVSHSPPLEPLNNKYKK